MKLKAEKIMVSREETSVEFSSFNDLSDGRILKTVGGKEWNATLKMASKPKVEMSFSGASGREKLLKLRKFLENALG